MNSSTSNNNGIQPTKQGVKIKNTNDIKKELQKIKMKAIVFGVLSRAALVFVGYIVAYMHWSLLLPLILIGSLVYLDNKTRVKSTKISLKAKQSGLQKEDILKLVDELPTWVTFPDRERAEWLNEIILQLWPNLSHYLIKLCRGSLQTNIKKKFDSFRFEEIDFGVTPPKIDGVKVYKTSLTKDCIIIDFDVFYDSDCDINFSMSGAQIGRIRDFQMGVAIRVILKPLLTKTPLIGGIQIFFLNTPEINFELEGISGIPGFSYFIRQKIEEKIKKKIVFPNKISKRFTKTVEAAELKALEPEGVLRVHVFEAKDLERKDVTGKSDPYVVLNVGAQECTTPVIKRSLNPQWDYWCEFVILDPLAQQLYFKVYDQDEFNEDDFLGSGAVEISGVIKPEQNDKWFALEDVKHGKLHLRFTWLGLSTDYSTLNAAIHETKLLKVSGVSQALLTIYIASAHNLAKIKSFKKPDPYLRLTVGKVTHKGRVKRHTTDPLWEQGFLMLVPNPAQDVLVIDIIDKPTDTKLDQLVYYINDLVSQPDMQFSKAEFCLSNGQFDSKIVVSLQLRILTNALFEDEDVSESESDENFYNSSFSPREFESPPKQDFLENLRETLELEESSTQVSRNSSIKSTDSPTTLNNLSKTSTPNSSIKKRNVKPVYSTIDYNQLGRIEVTVSYSELRQKLIVKIHRIENLPQKGDDIPDPYVKLKLVSAGHSTKNKTRVVPDSCNPSFEEKFEYLLSAMEIAEQKLILTVKSKKLFHGNFIGQAIINFKGLGDLAESYTCWYDLIPEQDSE